MSVALIVFPVVMEQDRAWLRGPLLALLALDYSSFAAASVITSPCLTPVLNPRLGVNPRLR